MTLLTLRQAMLQSSNTSMATSPLLLSMLMAVWRSEHEQRLPMPGGSVDSTLTNKNQIYEAAVNLLLEQSLTKNVGWERVGTPNDLKRECWSFLQQLAFALHENGKGARDMRVTLTHSGQVASSHTACPPSAHRLPLLLLFTPH